MLTGAWRLARTDSISATTRGPRHHTRSGPDQAGAERASSALLAAAAPDLLGEDRSEQQRQTGDDHQT